jgi:hypothetical protein
VDRDLFLCGRFELRKLGDLLFGNDLFTLRGAVQSLYLSGSKLAESAWWNVQPKGAVADSTDLFDVVTNLLEHLAKLTIAALDKSDLVPGVVTGTDKLDLGGSGDHSVAATGSHLVEATTIDHDAAAKLLNGGLGRSTGNLYKIGFFDAGRGLGERVRQIPVVSHQQEAFREVIEAADGVKTRELAMNTSDLLLRSLGEELGYRWAILRVFEGSDVAAGLVEHEVAVRLGALKELAIYADVVAGWVMASAQGVYDDTVDLNTAFENELLGLAAGGDTGLCEDFLQTIAGGVFLRICFDGFGRHMAGFLTADMLIAVGRVMLGATYIRREQPRR